MQEIHRLMPQYDYLYVGDNARQPYGTRSFEIVYEFTREAVRYLFEQGCHLIILACNTASAKALRTIQQNDLPEWDASRRVLGIIRPTAEIVGELTRSRHVGIMATNGTVRSQSYPIEIQKLHPDITVAQEACPMWVPLVENYEFNSPGADYFVQKYLEELMDKDPEIDTIILGCTHYPLLLEKIRKYAPEHVQIVPQGTYVAHSLRTYLQKHTEMEAKCTQGGTCRFFTTESSDKFKESAAVFLQTHTMTVEQITLK